MLVASESPFRAKVLVVEDELLIRMMTADELRDRGFDVHEAGSGDEALALIAGGLDVDIVFSDVRMPGRLNGVALAQEVRALRPGVQVVLTSAYLDRAAPGIGAFVAKPYVTADVLRAFDRLLD